MTQRDETDTRSPGDDTVIRVRVRRVNLPILESGFTLPGDSIVQFVPRDDDAHDFRIVSVRNPHVVVRDAVDARRVS